MTALEEVAQEVLREALAKHPLRQTPTIQWKRLRVSAGLAYYRSGRIGLSSILLDTPEKLRTTLLHEYAHLLAYERHGKKAANHGVYWQQAMRDLGLEPVVRHRYEVVRNTSRQQVTYRCLKCGATIVRSRRLPRNRRYVHAPCGGDLRLFSVQPGTCEAAHL